MPCSLQALGEVQALSGPVLAALQHFTVSVGESLERLRAREQRLGAHEGVAVGLARLARARSQAEMVQLQLVRQQDAVQVRMQRARGGRV